MEEVSTALDQLHDLKRQYVLVSTKTNALHEACEQSMQDQVGYQIGLMQGKIIRARSFQIHHKQGWLWTSKKNTHILSHTT